MDKRHTNSKYESELSQIRENLLLMAGQVEQMIERSVSAFTENKLEVAKKTIESDHRVNRLEVDTDELCLMVLAKRQPLASDLRFITLAMKMVTDLERIGDLTVNICERALAMAALDPVEIPVTISKMASSACAMIRAGIDTFIAADADRAQAICESDSEIDDLYVEVCNYAQQYMSENPKHLQQGMHIQAVAKFLERIGDHGTNLAELVIFMVKGKDIRHLGKLIG